MKLDTKFPRTRQPDEGYYPLLHESQQQDRLAQVDLDFEWLDRYSIMSSDNGGCRDTA